MNTNTFSFSRWQMAGEEGSNHGLLPGSVMALPLHCVTLSKLLNLSVVLLQKRNSHCISLSVLLPGCEDST